MPNRTDLDARLDAIAAQMPRFRQDFDRVFADIAGHPGPPDTVMPPAPEPRQTADPDDAMVDRATHH